MARGGKRPGAGRPKGAPNKATAELQQAVAESGVTPLDYLLSVMRDKDVPRQERVDAAHKAAPYVHAKLSNIDHQSSDGSMTPRPDRIELVAAGVDGKG